MEAVESAMGLGIVLKVKDMASNQFGKIRSEMAATKDGAGDLIKSFDANMKKMAMGLGMVATGAGMLATTFVKPIAMAMSSQYKMAEVNTLLGRNQEALMESLGAKSSELAMKFGKSGAEMSSAMYTLISSGVDAKKVGGVLDTVGKLAIGGMTDMATASDGLTSLMNAFGIAAENSGSVADSMFIAMKRGKTTIGELSSSIGQVAPIAAKAGMSIDDMLGSIATATLSGLGTSESATGLRATLSAIMQPSEQAKKMAAELGIEFNEQALRAKGLRGVLQTLMQATKGDADQMGALLGSIEAFGFASNIMKNDGSIWSSIMDDMAKKAGAADEAFSIVADTWLHKWNVIKTTFTVGIKRFGAVFLPIMGVILAPLGMLVKAFANIPKPILLLIGCVVAFGSAMLISRGSILACTAAMKLWSLGARSHLVAGAIAGQKAMFGLNTTFLRSAALMGGQIAAVYLLYKAYQNNFGGIKTAISWISAAWDVAMSATEDGAAKIKKSVLEGLGFDDTNMHDGVAIISRIASVFFRIKIAVIEFGSAFKNEFNYVIGMLDEFGQSILGLGGSAFTDMLKSLLNIDRSSLQAWKDWGAAIGIVMFYIVAIGVPLLILVKGFGLITSAISGFVSVFVIIGAAIGKLMSVLAFIKTLIGIIVTVVSVIGFIPMALLVAAALIYIYWDEIVQIFNSCCVVVGAFIADACTALGAFGTAVGSLIGAAVSFAVDLFVAGFTWLVEFLWGIGTVLLGVIQAPLIMIISFISGFCSTFFTSGASLWDAFCEGIRSAINGPVEVVKEGLARVRRLLPFSDAKEGPLSTLTLSGTRLMTTIATGVEAGAPELRNTIGAQFAAMPVIGQMPDVSGTNDFPRTSTMNILTERFTSTRETNTIEKTDSGSGQPTIIENNVYLDGEQVHRSVKRHDRYDRLRGGDDSAE